jgi:hypothetical protein
MTTIHQDTNNMSCPHNYTLSGVCSACGSMSTMPCTTCRRGPSFCMCATAAGQHSSLSLHYAGQTPAIKYEIGGETMLDLPAARIFEYTATNNRPPPPASAMSIGVIVDTSGSMGGGRLAAAQQALTTFINEIPLGPEFRPVDIQLASFTRVYRPGLFNGPLTVASRKTLLQAIDGLYASGGTDFSCTVASTPMQTDVVLFTTDADRGNWSFPDRKLEHFFPNSRLLLVDVGSSGTGFASISNLAPLKGYDAIERGLDTIREEFFNQVCIHPPTGRFSGNSGGSKLWVGPGIERTGYYLLEGADVLPEPLPYNAAGATAEVERGWSEQPNDPEKMKEIAKRRLQTIPDDYKAAVQCNPMNIDLDQEFIALALKSARDDYGVDLGWPYFDKLGQHIQAVKHEAVAQRTVKNTVAFDIPTNDDDGSNSLCNTQYRRRHKRRKTN